MTDQQQPAPNTVPQKRYSGLKPFVKGDPRINRKGTPKKFATLLKLLESLDEERVILTDGTKGETVEVRIWKAKSRFRLRIANDLGEGKRDIPRDYLNAFLDIDREWNDRRYGKPKQVLAGDPDNPLQSSLVVIEVPAEAAASAPKADGDGKGGSVVGE